MTRSILSIAGAAVCLATAVACGGGATPEPTTPSTASTSAPPTTATTPAPATFADQVAAGQKLYADNCASCHGAAGEGKQAPKVVGLKAGALPLDPPAGAKYRKSQFKTVADVADFVVKTMPPGHAGGLSQEEYLDILAFDLQANGIDLGDKKLDGALAATLTIPR